jgi:hypothetical protein
MFSPALSNRLRHFYIYLKESRKYRNRKLSATKTMKRKVKETLSDLFSDLEINKKFKIEEISESLRLLKLPLLDPIDEEETSATNSSKGSHPVYPIAYPIAYPKYSIRTAHAHKQRLNPENSQIILYKKNKYTKTPNGK